VAAGSLPEQLIAAGHWKRARSLVEARLHEAPGDPLANFLLSQIRNAFGDRQSPLPLAEKAVALDAGTAKYHRQVAEVLGVMAQHAGVWQQLMLARRFRKEIDLALALDPRDIQALRDLMEFYLLAPGIAGGDVRKADSIARRIAAVDLTEGYLAEARISEFEKRTAGVEQFLREAADSRPPRYIAHIRLAEFYASAGASSGSAAEQQAKEALLLDETRVEAYTLLAGIYADRRDWSALDEILAQASREDPDDLAPYYRVGDRLLASGRNLADAERYFRRYLAQESEGNEPTASEAHWKLGLVLEKEGQASEALSEWKESLQLDPASPAGQELKRLSGKKSD
jgi:tetratricopeptide (TPR) repeat protein